MWAHLEDGILTLLLSSVSSEFLVSPDYCNFSPSNCHLFFSSDNSAVLITPTLASQCGFSMNTGQLGNTMIYASLQNCFAQNVVKTLKMSCRMATNDFFFLNVLSPIYVYLQDDMTFTTILNLRLYGSGKVEDELHQVVKTCHYTLWASREIVCDGSYMEASECSRGHVAVYDKWLYFSIKADSYCCDCGG